MIKILRIDHRLLHGQVVFSWSKYLDLDHIIVADKYSASNAIAKMALGLAKPAEIKLDIIDPEDIVQTLQGTDDANVMIVVKNVHDALTIVEKCPEIKEVNFGGIAKKEGSKEYSKTVFLTPEDEGLARQIEEKGVITYTQQIPSESRNVFTI